MFKLSVAKNALNHKLKTRLSLLLVIAVYVSCLGFFPKQVAALSQENLTFTEIGTHPQASVKSQTWMRQITEMSLFNNKLLTGYGDYNSNIGPISINPFNIGTSSFEGESLVFQSESIGNFKKINGKLYTTTIDPRGCALCAAGYAVSSDGTNWELKTPVTALHIFDIETLTGTDLWLFGSAVDTNGVPTVWRSLDDGETWNAMTPPATTGDRFYWGKALNGKMYTQSFGDGNGPLLIFDGTSWTSSNVDPICNAGDYSGGPNPVVYDGKIICYWSNHINVFDGTTLSSIEPVGLVHEKESSNILLGNATMATSDAYYMLDDTQFYVSNQPAQVLRSPDLINWQVLRGMPNNTTTMTIDETNKKMYVGTYDAKIFVADLPDVPAAPQSNNEAGNDSLNNGDANNDGILDSTQPNVSVITSSVSGKPVVLEVANNCSVQTFNSVDESTLNSKDQYYNYANALINFTADCGTPGATTHVKLFYYDVTDSNLTVRKYNPNTSKYSKISNSSIDKQVIDGHNVSISNYQITDGQELDTDGLANGIIVDPVGLGAPIAGTPNTGSSRSSNSRNAYIFPVMTLSLVFYSVVYRKKYQ